MRALAVMIVALPIAIAPASGWAFGGQGDMASSEILQQRTDVDEIVRPQPPSGPATPILYCSPGSPVCP